jgi:cAMP-specific phosphodiesterase 4
VIDSVLCTDITYHAKNLSHLKSLLKFNDVVMGSNLNNLFSSDNISKNFENQRFVLGMILHAADISNACKSTHLQKMWVDLLMVELFNQGDIEKENNLPISILCDREKVNINKSQIGFINFIVLPTFETLIHIIPEMEPYVIAGKTNLSRYENLIKEENKK